MSIILIQKRDGSKENLNLEKIHRVLECACEGINNVSVSEIELKAELLFYEGMSTAEIQETLIKSTADLINEETPNYQYVAARLISIDLRKRVYGDVNVPPLLEIVKKNVSEGFYTAELLEWYSEDEFAELDRIVKHDRDNKFAYAGMEQFRQKYLVKNRVTGKIYETPQVANILIAATAFHDHANRMKWIEDFYNALSNFDISLPTPIMAGVRTPLRQFSSCTVIDVGDDLNSISAAASAIVRYAAQRAGIGINVGRLRAVGSKIRNGDAVHTGMVPFIKYLTAALKSCVPEDTIVEIVDDEDQGGV